MKALIYLACSCALKIATLGIAMDVFVELLKRI